MVVPVMALVALTGTVRLLHAQNLFLDNPSFEGPPGLEQAPPGWIPAGERSTPDTEPLDCDPFPAADGATYMTLVTRPGRDGSPESAESAAALLREPLKENTYYRATLRLASRDDVGHFDWSTGFHAYTDPVGLAIHAASASLEKGVLLAGSDPIRNTGWLDCSLILFPLEPVEALLLEIVPTEPTVSGGNLCLDHFRLTELEEAPLDYGDLEVPNAFTPNADGINDAFVIRGLPEDSYLLVFDRSGREVHRSKAYRHDWEGTDAGGRPLPPGTYWYLLFPGGRDEVVKGFVYLKRE
ncbi:MAG: gliding motility-associated C-terminal domain-containing protein [Bacteroidales bacterium]